MTKFPTPRIRIRDRIKYLEKNPYRVIFFSHAFLFAFLYLLALVFFNTDLISSFWAPGSHNDSKLYISNTLNYPPLYPHVLLGTSLHYVPGLVVLSIFLPLKDALTISILSIQFSASLFSLCLLYSMYVKKMNLGFNQATLLVLTTDLVLFSPYLLIPAPEILFLFYQSLAWHFLDRKKYFFAGITSAMTFALRYNGAFFVVGTLILIVYYTKKDLLSPRGIFWGIIVLSAMFAIGFVSYIAAWVYSGDFWLPLIREISVYQGWEPYASNGVITFPFAWFPDYLMWLLTSGPWFELLLFGTVLVSLGLGITSLISFYQRFKASSISETKNLLPLAVLFFCGFLGVSIVASGRNLARFLTFSFPTYPILAFTIEKYELNGSVRVISLILAGLLGLILNIGWWMTY
ncbi:MAG: hypothetical protein ACFFE8_05615 [Candidatus Heimdallarchaeota archaeon]